MAMVPVLLINAEQKVVTEVRAIICTQRLSPMFFMAEASASTTPERHSAWLIMSTAATVMTAGLPKPLNTSAVGTKPRIAADNSAIIATRS